MPTYAEAQKRITEWVEEVSDKKGDYESIIKIVVQRIKGDPGICDTLTTDMLWTYVRQIVYRVHSAQRMKAKSVCMRGAEAIEAANLPAAQSVLDTWKINGQSLGDFTGSDLLPYAAWEQNMSQGHRANAEFFESLAKIAGKDRIRDRVTVENADRLWRLASSRANREALNHAAE